MSSLAAILALAACSNQGPGKVQRQIDPAYITKNLLTEPPAQMTNPVNADFGGKIVYLGNDVQTDTISPGDKVTLVHYWKVLEPPGDGWRVFAHLEGVPQKDWLNVDDTDMRYGYPPSKWKAGDIIRDEQMFRLSKSWSSPFAQLSVGLFKKGGQTVKDRMPIISGPADEQSRVPVMRFKVLRESGVPSGYVIRRASGPITIDGRMDDEAWKLAPPSPPFETAEGSPEVGAITKARMLWDDENLYVYIDVEDSDVASQFTNQDDTLWKEDVVELFIDADRNRRGYVELQVNPNNAQLDAWFATTRAGATDMEWSAGMRSAVAVNGTVNQREDQDQGWEVEIAIPLAAVKGRDAAMQVNVPPRVGDVWRMNVVRIDKPKDKNLAASSWNQITYQDFHALGRMFEARFGNEQGAITPVPVAPPAMVEGMTPAPNVPPATEGATPAPTTRAPAPTTPPATVEGAVPGAAAPVPAPVKSAPAPAPVKQAAP